MNLSWYIFLGLKIGLSRSEVLFMRYGEMMDLINCYNIDQGVAKPKRRMTFDEVLALR